MFLHTYHRISKCHLQPAFGTVVYHRHQQVYSATRTLVNRMWRQGHLQDKLPLCGGYVARCLKLPFVILASILCSCSFQILEWLINCGYFVGLNMHTSPLLLLILERLESIRSVSCLLIIVGSFMVAWRGNCLKCSLTPPLRHSPIRIFFPSGKKKK